MTQRHEEDDLQAGLRRVHLPTILRLHAKLQQEAEAAEWTYRDYLAHPVAEELAHRAETRVQRATHKAKFPFVKTIEEFDFTFQASVQRKALGRFLGPELVTEGRAVILLGQPGRGKTHLAIAFAYKAIQNGFEARFVTAATLLNELHLAARDGTLEERLAAFVDPDVLVLDERSKLTRLIINRNTKKKSVMLPARRTLKDSAQAKCRSGVIKKMFGKSLLVEEINHMLSHKLSDYIKENNLRIIGEPLPNHEKAHSINWDNQKNFEFEYQIGIAEDFKYDLSTKVKIKSYPIEVDETVINETIADLTKRFGKADYPEVSEATDNLFGGLTPAEEGGFKNETAVIDITKVTKK